MSTRKLWNKKRLFLEFLGESGRVGGSSHVKVCPDTGDVTLHISEGLMKLSCLKNRKIVVGHVIFKNGNESIYSSIENRTAIGYQFVWNNSKNIWRIHASVRLEKPDKKSSSRICGIDHNAGFLSATIVDKHANVVSKREFKYSHSRDIPQLCHDIIQWCEFNKCHTISIEKLKGLHKNKRKTKSSAKKLNHVLNRICSLGFSTKMKNVCDSKGVTLKIVSPYKTSQATTQWNEGIFGVTTHEKASYLIARRGMGLSIDRRPRKTPLNNSVCSEVLGGKKSMITTSANHDSTDSSVCVVNRC